MYLEHWIVVLSLSGGVSVHASEFHRLPGHLQRSARDSCARSDVVWTLWNFVMARRYDRRQAYGRRLTRQIA